jgi:hypothetical protein
MGLQCAVLRQNLWRLPTSGDPHLTNPIGDKCPHSKLAIHTGGWGGGGSQAIGQSAVVAIRAKGQCFRQAHGVFQRRQEDVLA